LSHFFYYFAVINTMGFEKLIEFIPELLYEHNCVIIPGFGGFITNYRPAGFEESRNLISPQAKKVAFNQSLNQNDGLLVSQWSNKQGINYKESLEYIESFVFFLKNQMNALKSYDFKNIGTFYQNQENNLIFVPQLGTNFLHSSYGLFPVKIKPIQFGTTLGAEDKRPVLEVANDDTETFHTETFSLPKRKNYGLKIAAVILFFATASFSIYYLFNQLPKNGFAYKPKVQQEASIISIDSNLDETLDKKETLVLPEYKNELKKIEEIKNKLHQFSESNATSSKVFKVVAGNFAEESQALKLQKTISNDFSNTQIELTPQNRYLVNIETFYKYTTAETFCVMLKQRGYTDIRIEETPIEDTGK
jgi:nucleoid DNA-binding protein